MPRELDKRDELALTYAAMLGAKVTYYESVFRNGPHYWKCSGKNMDNVSPVLVIAVLGWLGMAGYISVQQALRNYSP